MPFPTAGRDLVPVADALSTPRALAHAPAGQARIVRPVAVAFPTTPSPEDEN